MTERDVLRDTRLLLAEEFKDGVFFRNSTGMTDTIGIRKADIQRWISLVPAHIGQEMRVALSKAYAMRFGLAPGSSDLIGCVRGRFCAPEAKYGRGVAKAEQLLFQELVRSKGGIAFTFWEPEECVRMLKEELEK